VAPLASRRVTPTFDGQRCVRLCRQQGLRLGCRIVHNRVTDSTNDDALTLAKQGAAHGVVVIADEQRRGRGRRGTRWSCPSGEGLIFSVVLRARWQASHLSVLPLVIGLGVREVAARHLSEVCQVKWPNDVLVRGRKLCGILLEAHFTGGVTEAVVVGVGLNVLVRRFPEELASRATSLALLGATLLEREALLVELLAAFERRTLALFNRGFHDQWLEITHCDALRNKRVRVDDVEGIALGVAENGGLLLRSAGRDQVLLAGTVVLLGDA
jgi:BirA family transcriptional regulator, biotin operon repressor / biotin---[acetyl-CoA-carboxylase] ligase